MNKNFFKKNKYKFLYVLILISTFSFLNTLFKGSINGCDFQWQPSVLFWEGINHYNKFIINGKGDFLCQNGEYAHLLHVLYYPFTLFSWEKARILWLIVNVFFIFLIPYLMCRFLKLSNFKTILLILIFITCYPTRMSLNYGQQSLFVMFFMMMPFIFNSKSSIFASGFSSVKYSSGYIIFLNFLVTKNYKNFFISIIPYLIGWIIYFSYTNSDPITNFFEPIQLTLQSGYRRDGDIYSLLQIYFLNGNKIYSYFCIVLIFIVNFFFLISINKIKDTFLQMSLIFLCPLIFFPHSNYDYVLLFPLACYSLQNMNSLINKFNFYFIIYFYYLSRQVKHLLDVDWLYQPILLFLIVSIVFLNIKFNLKKMR